MDKMLDQVNAVSKYNQDYKLPYIFLGQHFQDTFLGYPYERECFGRSYFTALVNREFYSVSYKFKKNTIFTLIWSPQFKKVFLNLSKKAKKILSSIKRKFIVTNAILSYIPDAHEVIWKFELKYLD